MRWGIDDNNGGGPSELSMYGYGADDFSEYSSPDDDDEDLQHFYGAEEENIEFSLSQGFLN